MKKNFSRSTALLSSLLLLGLLTACDHKGPIPPRQITVDNARLSHEVSFDKHGSHLSSAELWGIHDFVDQLPISALSRVEVLGDLDKASAKQRLRTVRAVLVRHGVPFDAVRLIDTGEPADEYVMIEAEFAVAMPPQGCPDWSRSAVTNHHNKRQSNYGCAYYNNFAHMLANPNDLAGGHTDNTPDATRTAAAIQAYRNAGVPSSSESPAEPSTTGSSGGATTQGSTSGN